MDRKLNSTIKAVIFDMDGVLIDSEPLWRKAEIETFNELGFDFTDEMCRQTMGMRTKEVIEYWHNVLQWKNKSIDEVTQILLDKIHQSIQERKTTPRLMLVVCFACASKTCCEMATASRSRPLDCKAKTSS